MNWSDSQKQINHQTNLQIWTNLTKIDIIGSHCSVKFVHCCYYSQFPSLAQRLFWSATPSAEVACYTRCAQTSLSIHQQHYLHATPSAANARVLCKQPGAFPHYGAVDKTCRVAHYGSTTNIQPWLHYITLDAPPPPPSPLSLSLMVILRLTLRMHHIIQRC